MPSCGPRRRSHLKVLLPNPSMRGSLTRREGDMNVMRHATATPFRAALIALVALIIAGLPTTVHAATSTTVAYVTEFGTGSNDTTTPGSSIFVNALTGIPPHGSYTTDDGAKAVSIVDVSVAVIEANPMTALTGFDTVILYQVCGIGDLPNTRTAISAFLDGGGKLLIFDGDRCSSLDGSAAMYGDFVAFAFAANRLGPNGTTGAYTNVQPSTLTSRLVLGPATNALSDANLLSTLVGAWCGSITATPTTGAAGFVQAYARTAKGGLVIYEGENFWRPLGLSAHLRQLFDRMLVQDWNPDGLACALPGSGIALSPVSQRIVAGSLVGLTATVVDANGIPRTGVSVDFGVISGPNIGNVSGGNLTDADGRTGFTYPDRGGAGTDTLVAGFSDGRNAHSSNTASVVWAPTNTPPVALRTNVTMSNTAGVCTAPASINNGSFNPDPGDTITLSQSPAGPFGAGTTMVTLTVTDSKGEFSTCTGTVTVLDTEPPTVTCPAPITVECSGGGSAPASFAATARDNCDAAVVSCPASGTSFPLGTTAVTCNAADTAKNASSCTTSVTVVDTKPPMVSCLPGLNPSGSSLPSSDGGFYTVWAGDSCGAATITFGGIVLQNGETIKITQAPGQSGVSFNNTMGPLAIKHFLVGSGAATLAATDASGNVATTLCLVPSASN